MTLTTDVIVVGAGVVGCSVAYYLASSGAKVTLLEREAIGSGASTHATGSPSTLGAEFSPGASFELALAGYREFIDLVPRLESETGANLLYQRRPALRLALDEDEVSLVKGMMDWQGQMVDIRWIDGDEVRRIEPRLSPNIRGAVYEDESAQLDSYRLNLALAHGAERHGAEVVIREVIGLLTHNNRVTGVRTAAGDISADTVVV
ncbi:MAG: FAD-dependent oxidoreductase, partial [Chloroflexi bacterium]|nr:FAD-dependent oxidoreductase [Chloroflexota bacterium]